MTTIGTAVLQIIPSLDGVSSSIDKQLGGTLRASGKEGGKALAKGVGEGLKDLEREVESAGKAYQKLKDKASDALGKVRTEEAKLVTLRNAGKQDTAQYVAIEERRNKALRDSDRAAREATDGHNALLSAQKRLGDGTENLGRKFDGLSRFASSAGRSLGAVGVLAGGAALAGVALLAAGVAAAGRELYNLGAQFDDLSDNLQVKTGLSGAALDKLKDSVEKLGTTNVPSTFAEIGNVAAEVTRNLHLTGQPLEDVTSRLANLKRLGVEVNVRELGKAFRGFGVDIKNQVPALNGLYEASTKSGLSIDDMLASVVKGGPALRALGLSFGESAALISTFEDAGLDADKSIAGLTKGLANFSKNGKTGSDALRDAVTQIKALASAGNDAGAIDLSNKLFGAKGGVAFFDAIKSGNLDLQSLSDSLSSTGVDINQVSADTADWSEKWQDLKNEVAVALEPLAGSIFDQVNGQLDNLSVWMTGHKDEVIDFFVGFGEAAISAAQVTTSALAGVVDFVHLFDTIVMKSLSWLPDYDDEAAKAFNDSLGDLSTKLNAASDSGLWSNLRDQLHNFGEEAKNSGGDVLTLSGAIGQLAGRSINVPIKIDTGPANTEMEQFFSKWKTAVLGLNPPSLPAPRPAGPGSLILPPAGRATGGAIFGAGTATSDSIPAWLSNGEHVWTADEVKKAGGQAAMYKMRSMVRGFSGGGGLAPWPLMDPRGLGPHGGKDGDSAGLGPFAPWWDMDWEAPEHPAGIGASIPGVEGKWWHRGPNPGGQSGWRAPPLGKYRKPLPGQQLPPWLLPHDRARGFSGGGAVGPDVLAAGELVGTAYSKPNRTDCSGMVARVIDRTLGMPEVGLMSTKNAAEWLAARGFKPGIGGPGQISVGWYDHGPNPNDGHMAMTLSDGTPAESGGGVGDIFQIGGGAAGATSPQFDQHMFLPTLYGEGPAGSGSASPFAGGSAAAAVTGGSAQTSSSGSSSSTPSSSGGGGSSFSLPSSFSGLATMGLDQMTAEGKARSGPGHRDPHAYFPEAASAAISGQIDSALGVFGVNGSPGWLKAVSTLFGGISIGGDSAAPLSASPSGMGTPPPDDPGNMHGTRAGQQPGPTYNVYAQDAEDALNRLQRLQDRQTAAKLGRF